MVERGGPRFLRGGKPVGFPRRSSALAPAVFLAPEHRELLTGSPRACGGGFSTGCVLGLKPASGDDLGRYATALKERNALLARAPAPAAPAAAGELEAWTEELAVAGSAVRRHRIAALAALGREFGTLARRGRQRLRDVQADAIPPPDDSADALRAACQRLLALERRRGYSLAGPHRDDLLWTRDGRPLAAQASAGEVARTVALVKLAEWSARRAGLRASRRFFAADDFDAGLSEGWVEEFFDALPAQAAVLLTTAAPRGALGRPRVRRPRDVRGQRPRDSGRRGRPSSPEGVR